MIIQSNKNKNNVWLSLIYVAFVIVTLILGISGFLVLFNEKQITFKLLFEVIYNTLKLFILETDFQDYSSIPPVLNIARFLAPISLILPILKVLFNVLMHSYALVRIKLSKEHTVFCGLGLKAKLAIESKNYNFKHIVVIEKNPDNIYLNNLKYPVSKIMIFIGDAADVKILKKANVSRAQNIFVNTGNDISNLNIAQNIKGICLEKSSGNQDVGRKPKVIVDLYDAENEIMFKQLEYAMFQNKSESSDSPIVSGIQLTAFNIYRFFAGELVHEYSPDKFIALQTEKNKAAHVLIYGFSKMGQCLLTEAAHTYHFAHGKTTKITVVDKNIEEKRQAYLKIQPSIHKVVDVSFVETDTFFSDFTKNTHDVDLCFVSAELDAENYIISHRLRQLFFDRNLSNLEPLKIQAKTLDRIALLSQPKIVLASSHFDDVFEILTASDSASDFKKLEISVERMYPKVCVNNKLLFGNEIIDDIAKQIYINYCVTNNDDSGKIKNAIPCLIALLNKLPAASQHEKQNTIARLQQIGNASDVVGNEVLKEFHGIEKRIYSQKWEFLTDDEKDQNRWAARHMFIKLRYLNAEIVPAESVSENDTLFNYNQQLENSDKAPKAIKEHIARWEHQRWLAEKHLTGFVPGIALNDKAFYKEFLKTRLRWHLCIVPWGHLSKDYQDIDAKLTHFHHVLSGIELSKVIIKK